MLELHVESHRWKANERNERAKVTCSCVKNTRNQTNVKDIEETVPFCVSKRFQEKMRHRTPQIISWEKISLFPLNTVSMESICVQEIRELIAVVRETLTSRKIHVDVASSSHICRLRKEIHSSPCLSKSNSWHFDAHPSLRTLRVWPTTDFTKLLNKKLHKIVFLRVLSLKMFSIHFPETTGHKTRSKVQNSKAMISAKTKSSDSEMLQLLKSRQWGIVGP
jgi:hypothetical protein